MVDRAKDQIDRIINDIENEFQGPKPLSPDAWFLGGHAENEALLRKLFDEVIAGHVKNRRAYAPKDPPFL